MKVSEALHILESNMAPAQWTGDCGSETPCTAADL